jgi:TetR/AcrR family transcriptional repressor of nem operon
MTSAAQHDSKTKLLDAALQVIRAKGYAATTVEDICTNPLIRSIACSDT